MTARAGMARRVVEPCLLMAVGVAGAGALLRHSGVEFAWYFLAILGMALVTLTAIITAHLWPEAQPLSWPAAVDSVVPPLARERRTERLADECRAACSRTSPDRGELQQTLLEITTQRLVRHGADPASPLDTSTHRLSPELVGYLTSQPVAPLSRTTLAAFLKEIDDL